MVGCFLNRLMHEWVAHENATSKWLKIYENEDFEFLYEASKRNKKELRQ